MLLYWILLVVLLCLFYSALIVVCNPEHRWTFQLWRGLRWRHFRRALLAMTAVVSCWAVLRLVPGMSIGWYMLVDGTGTNIALGHTGVRGWASTVLAFLFAFFLVIVLPKFALSEEREYRAGAEWRTRLERFYAALAFGVLHILMGIPVGLAFALTAAGVTFTHFYLKTYNEAKWAVTEHNGWTVHTLTDRNERAGAALEEVTLIHLAYNAIALGLSLMVLLGVTLLG